MEDTGWSQVQKSTKKNQMAGDSWRRPHPATQPNSWRATTQKAVRRSRSPSRSLEVSLYTPAKKGMYNYTDGQTVTFSSTGPATSFIYPYIEYYQYIPYSSTSIYKWNTRIQTVLSQLNQSDRINTHPWVIPVGRTLSTYQMAHQALVEHVRTMPDYTSLYVCGIAYRNTDGTIPDIQLTLTGTVDGNDTPAKTAKKELAEEIGLDASQDSFQLIPQSRPNHHLFIISARNCVARVTSSASKKSNSPPVNSKRSKDKVIVAVIGSLEELHSLLSTPRNRATADNELDLMNIDGVILTKVKDLMNMR